MLTKLGGGSFGITSIDLAALNSNAAGGFVTFTGDLSGGGTVTQMMSWNPSGGALTLSTNTFANTWTNLVSVKFSQVSPYFQFDNISTPRSHHGRAGACHSRAARGGIGINRGLRIEASRNAPGATG